MPRQNKPHRTKKGAVSVFARNGMLRVRWSHKGQRYDRALALCDNPINRKAAEGTAHRIEAAIAFDRLEQELLNIFPKASSTTAPPKSTADLFRAFMEHKAAVGTGAYRLQTRYKALLSHLQKWTEIDNPAAAANFVNHQLRPRQCASTINSNQQMLRAFGQWATEQGHWPSNHFEGLPKVIGHRDRTKRSPFSSAEIDRILIVLANNKELGHWRDFILTLLTFGLRPSEAIGLRWGDLDFDERTLSISSALARNGDGRSSAAARERRLPKTGESGIRILPVPEEMHQLFQQRKPCSWTQEDLIFLSPQGRTINDHVFSQGAWKRILKAANVKHRPPYTCRHTTASHLIHDGATLPETAQVLGHKDTSMLAKVYAHSLQTPKLRTYTTPDLHQPQNSAPERLPDPEKSGQL